MHTLRENINYREHIICSHCKSQIQYHVTDIKSVNERFIICPQCGHKVYIDTPNVSSPEES